MRRPTAMIRSITVLASLSFALATPASAQLGKLKKIATDAAKDAAAGKKPEAPGSTSAKIDYTITDERASAIIAALTPLVERAKKEKELADAKAAYETKSKPIMECYNKLGKGGQMPDMSSVQSPAYEALTKRLTVLTQRAAALEGKTDYRGAIATQDTSLVLQMQMTASMFGGKCPAIPYKPAAMIDAEAEFMKMARSGVAPASDHEFVVAPEKRAGMSTGQYGKIRELIAIYTMQKSGDMPPNSYKFSDAELAVLNAKSAQLTAMAPYFKSGFLTWASWGDITAW